VPIVVLSNVPEDDQGMAALAAGASGYCSALTLPTVLHQVAGVVEHGGLWVGPQLMRRLMQGLAARNSDTPEPDLDRLSQRERQVAVEVARGATNKEIARALNITERTVKAHLTAAFEKLGVRDRMQLSLVVNGVEGSTRTFQKIPA
jgi:DNA-binding NarL/FixJ family response regulator